MKSESMKIKPIHIFSLLCLAFLIFSFGIYLKPITAKTSGNVNVSKASEGRLIWQKYNCQACHQLYGLGGYLGPDLTNEYSKFNGNHAALKAMFQGGLKQMPKFDLNEQEEDLLIEFLKQCDESGNADPRNYKIFTNGMIEQNGR